MNLDRKLFLNGLFATGAATFIASRLAGCRRPQAPDFPLVNAAEIGDLLRGEYGYLRFESTMPHTFGQAYLDVYGPVEKWELTRLKTVFLLSTDLFAESRTSDQIRFVTLYAPYHSPCYRPMS